MKNETFTIYKKDFSIMLICNAFDGVTIANVVYEMNQELIGGRLYKIAQPENDELILTIKSAEGNFRLLISASASSRLMTGRLNFSVSTGT